MTTAKEEMITLVVEEEMVLIMEEEDLGVEVSDIIIIF